MLSPELETRAFLGRPVVDIYGRSLGRVIGIERNAFGELEGVQVEAAGGLIVSVKARQLGLTRYLVNAKLDHKSGELDEESLKMAQGSIEPTLHPLIAERNDLAGSLKTLEEVLPSRVTISQNRQ